MGCLWNEPKELVVTGRKAITESAISHSICLAAARDGITKQCGASATPAIVLKASKFCKAQLVKGRRDAKTNSAKGKYACRSAAAAADKIMLSAPLRYNCAPNYGVRVSARPHRGPLENIPDRVEKVKIAFFSLCATAELPGYKEVIQIAIVISSSIGIESGAGSESRFGTKTKTKNGAGVMSNVGLGLESRTWPGLKSGTAPNRKRER
ncbi:hypothetical protein EVAR_32766_1 [Eumeta japonica]|uniref:Uncharacterized protein n=1 Tax=Eumeta variegata TaxID=151549 RepID=A0A4C1WBH5_EUMVA|nr:hypothetical protein EVAR_32766_1 [Eumeta japonica]